MDRKENTNKPFWNRIAKLYAPFMKSSDAMYREISQRITKYLKKDSNVLELACGTGQLTERLAGKVRLWEATDFSETMINEAKKRVHSSRTHFSVQDATSLPYAPQSFDIVLIANALHIMPKPEKALLEIRKVLTPDGILLAPTFVHAQGKTARLRVWVMEKIGFHAFHKWDTPELLKFISDHGFEITEAEILGDKLAPLCYVAAKKIQA